MDPITAATLGVQAANAAPGIASMFVGKKGRAKRAQEQIGWQNQLADRQFERDEQAADNALKRGMEMWEKTESMQALAKQAEETGINLGTALGIDGGGFTSGGASSGPQGGGGGGAGQAPSVAAMWGNQLQGAQQAAQLGLIAAQTKKTLAEAENLGEGGIVRATANQQIEESIKRMEAIGANIENTQVRSALGRVETEIKEIERTVLEATQTPTIQMVFTAAETAGRQYDLLGQAMIEAERNNEIGEAQAAALKKQADATLIYTFALMQAAKNGANLSEQQKQDLLNTVNARVAGAEAPATNAETNKERLEWEKEKWLWNSLFKVATGLVSSF